MVRLKILPYENSFFIKLLWLCNSNNTSTYAHFKIVPVCKYEHYTRHRTYYYYRVLWQIPRTYVCLVYILYNMWYTKYNVLRRTSFEVLLLLPCVPLVQILLLAWIISLVTTSTHYANTTSIMIWSSRMVYVYAILYFI